MGMVMELLRVTPDELAELSGDAEAFYDFLSTAQDDAENQRWRMGYLDKSWGIIHYLLTGTAWEGDEPASLLLLNDPLFDSDDITEMTPGLIAPEEVQAFADHLDGVDDATLHARFDVPAMAAADVYLMEDADRVDRDEMLDYTFTFVPVLRQYMREAATAGHAVITIMG